MKKDVGAFRGVFPMPVLMIATYDENGVPNVMNAAWGQICDMDKIALFISEGHKTTANIRANRAFTVSLASEATMKEADYFGMASANTMKDKFAHSGFTAAESKHVHAPVIQEFPIAMECELAEIIETQHVYAVIGKIVNVVAEEEVLTEKGGIDPAKLNAIAFSSFDSGYYAMGPRVGTAWSEGKDLLRK